MDQHRQPMAIRMPQQMPPQMQGYMSPSLPPPFLQERPTTWRVEVKLSASTTYTDCNTDRTVMTVVKKPAEGAGLTVAEFGRSVLTSNAPDWILKLTRRHFMARKRGKECVFLCFGGGYDLLVILDGADVPKDYTKVPRLSVSTSFATKAEEMRLGIEHQLPLACYSDGAWDHVSAVSSSYRGAPIELVAVISDSVAPYGALEGLSDRVKVVRVWTNAKNMFEATRFDHTQDEDILDLLLANQDANKGKAPKAPPKASIPPKPKMDSDTASATTKTVTTELANGVNNVSTASTTETAKTKKSSASPKKAMAPKAASPSKAAAPKATTTKAAAPKATTSSKTTATKKATETAKKDPVKLPAKKATPVETASKSKTAAEPKKSSSTKAKSLDDPAEKEDNETGAPLKEREDMEKEDEGVSVKKRARPKESTESGKAKEEALSPAKKAKRKRSMKASVDTKPSEEKADAEFTKKRGRPKGSKNKTKEE